MKVGNRLITLLTFLNICLPSWVLAVPLPLIEQSLEQTHMLENLAMPSESPAHTEFRYGISALIKNDLQTARQSFLKASKLDPMLAAPLLGLADVAVQQGNNQAAERWLMKASQVEPESNQTHIGWARYYRIQEDYAKAEDSLKKSIDLKPSATAYLELGDLYLADLGRIHLALEAYEQANKLAPENANVRYSLAVGLAANGQVDRAMQTFEEVASMRPNDPEPWRNIGRLYAEQNRFDEARRAFQIGLDLQPNFVPLLVDQGDLAVARGQLNEAVPYYEKAAGLAPTTTLLIKLGLAHQSLHHWAEAESTYRQAIDHDTKAADAYNNLAWLMVDRGERLNEAEQWAEQATQLSPGRATYLDTLGWVLYSRGEFLKAEQVFRKAAQMEPKNAEIHYHLGVVYDERGNRDDARKALNRALELQPGFPGSKDARRRLKTLNN